MQRNWMALLAATAMLMVWSAGAQALSIDLGPSRKAKLSESGDSVSFTGKQKKSRAAFSANLATDGFVDVVLTKRKGGKRKTVSYTNDLGAGDHDFTLKGKKRVTMTFHEGAGTPGPTVPEPGTVALLGLGLAGLSVAGRRRR